MKVLKKIKRRMGLASRSGGLSGGGSGTNNLPPLLFHNVHGDNIRISRDGTTAKRVESFCKGIVFSSRPVKINERVCLKFVDISHNWSGVIRFGFTFNDPNGHRNASLPKYACPDLTNKPGYWAKALPERYCTTNGTILHYYVTAGGDVHFGINGEEKGVFFGGVDCRGPLWALIDVYGNSTAIELVGQQVLNNTRNLNNNVERIMQPLSQLMIDDGGSSSTSSISTVSQCQVAPLRYQQGVQFAPMPLHQTRGRNVKFIDSSTAYRTDTEFCQGYVFTGRPLQLNERVVVQILNTEPMFHGCLALGLTSCDPHHLTTSDLPDDSNFLLDRPEYWVIARDFARNLNKFDEISFCITTNGEVHISRNGAAPLVVMHVDQTLKLWAFFDIYGSTQKVRVLSKSNMGGAAAAYRSINSNNINNNNSRQCSSIAAGSDSVNSLNSQSELRRQRPPTAVISSPKTTTIAPSTTASVSAAGCSSTSGASSALLVIINPDTVTTLPVATATLSAPLQSTSCSNASQLMNHSQSVAQIQASNNSLTTATLISSGSSSHYIEPVSTATSLYNQGATNSISSRTYSTTTTECTICYEKQIDAVLYMCGHMCMCYECALQQWRGKGGGQCPLCRAVIKDVIRTYKS